MLLAKHVAAQHRSIVPYDEQLKPTRKPQPSYIKNNKPITKPVLQKEKKENKQLSYAQPAFVDYPPVKNITNLGIWLSDIESHMDYRASMPGVSYRNDNDLDNWAHETLHGINSVIRNKYSNNVNAFYVLESKAIIIKEPPIRITDVARLIPAELRGMSYDLYLVQQARSWDAQPLYILDEENAYFCGVLVAMENKLNCKSSTQQMMEFMVYSIALCAAVENHNRQTEIKYDNTQLKAATRFFIERIMYIYKQTESGKYPGMQSSGATAVLRNLKANKSYCDFIKWYFTDEWTKKVFDF